jgi:general secretion pathway protein C
MLAAHARSLRSVDLLALGLCAVVLGHAVAGAAGARLAPASVAPPRTRAVPAVAPLDRGDRAGRIADRNLFCSSCPRPRDPAAADVASDPSPRRTRLPLELVAVNVAVAPWSISWSSVVLRHAGSRRMGGFPLGARVAGAIITAIHDTRIDLDHDGQKEFLDLIEDAAAGLEAPPPADPTAGPSADPLVRSLARGVRKRGERSYEIDRAVLEEALANVNQFARDVRVVPEARDGRPAGFRLTAVRPGSVLAGLGLQEGDLVAAINGLELTTAEQVLALYLKLKSASHLSVALERGGRRITTEYSVR